MPKKSIKAVDVNEIENPSELVPVQERFLLASIHEKTLESQTSDNDIPPCSVLKQKTVEGMTFFYSTEEELRQKVSHELDRIQAELEANERELEDLTERQETLGLFCKAMTAFPWLGDAIMIYGQHKQNLERRNTMRDLQVMEEHLRLVSTSELASFLCIPEKTIRNWTSQKKIPHYKVGALVRFNQEEIQRWYQARKVSPLSEPILNDRINSNV